MYTKSQRKLWQTCRKEGGGDNPPPIKRKEDALMAKEYFRDWTIEELENLYEEGYTFDIANGEVQGAYLNGMRVA